MLLTAVVVLGTLLLGREGWRLVRWYRCRHRRGQVRAEVQR
jgi:UPF0716 family protein affecting phage T7 exclusion